MAMFPNHYCPQHIEHEAEYIAKREQFASQHSKTYERHYNLVTRKRNEVKAEQDSFYHTKQWQSLRAEVLARDNHLDQYALLQGEVKQGNLVDHIVPIEYAPELKDDVNNLATTTVASHKVKTSWEQSYYGTGQGNQLKQVAMIKNIHDLPCFK